MWVDITIPEDVFVIDPATDEPLLSDDAKEPLKASFALYIRLITNHRLKTEYNNYDLIKLRMDLTSKPGTIVHVDTSTDAWKSLIEGCKSPNGAFLEDRHVISALTFRPYTDMLVSVPTCEAVS